MEAPRLPVLYRRCPACGCRAYVEDVESGLDVVVDGRTIQGDWTCLHCDRLLVDWTSYASDLRRYQLLGIARDGPRGGRPRKVRA
jgi:hypothetical protein